MWKGAPDSKHENFSILRKPQDGHPRHLSDLQDAHIQRDPERPAFYVRNARSKGEGAEYLSLTFAELGEERDIWLSRLKGIGVSPGDAVLVALPLGLAFLSASYALTKLGAELILLDPESDWKACSAVLRGLNPRLIIGSKARVRASRGLFYGLPSLEKRIRILDPLRRVGALKKGYELYGRRGSETTFSLIYVTCSSLEGARARRFGHAQLMALARSFEDSFSLGQSAVAIPVASPLLALLFPAVGLASVVPNPETAKPSAFSVDDLIESATHLKVSTLLADEAMALRVLRRCEQLSIRLPSLRNLLMPGMGASPELAELIGSVTGADRFHRLYSGGGAALTTVMEVKAEAQAVASVFVPGKGICLGKPAPNVQAEIAPLDRRSASRSALPERLATGSIGEIVVQSPCSGSLIFSNRGTRKKSTLSNRERTGEVGFVDESGNLWFCGRKEHLVTTSYGVFYSERSESLFNQHPKVKRCVLIALRKGARGRPGLVVETSKADFPSKKIDESKFKAELLQLAMDLEDARLITEFFFVKALPENPKGSGLVDREALSAVFSKKAKF